MWLSETRAQTEFVNCERCQGAGERRITDRVRYEVVGVSRKHWERDLREKYGRYALGTLRRWRAEIAEAVRSGILEESN